MSKARKAVLLTVVIAVVLMFATGARFVVHKQLYGHLHNKWVGNKAPDKNIWLPDYRPVIQAKPLEGITNLSGIAYDFDKDRLLGITNGGPMAILVMNRDGDLLDRYPLIGFEDTEGIAYIGGGRVVIADERLQQLDIVTLPDTPGPIHVEQAQFVAIGVNLSNNNKGFEGVTYDAANDRVFAIKERDPRQLYSVTGMLSSIGGPLQIRIQDLTSWIDHSVYSRDLSEGYYDPKTGHLLILSDESANITELDEQGNFVSILSLRHEAGDLKKSVPQGEGMTMDSDGELYVVSEPNLFYRFSKSKNTQVAQVEKP
ncbi:SdiA-regulated [Pseudomonas putida]|uniref:SdiA-regulated n=1 Tax=Pseudomonas putida TaxID=303 RepID=A0A2Z4RGP0_PSEPU|nr:SdiA-regulated domain-containing protein [Pseudomonas putida]AWY40213.1 SdiA-regulated [Pseudomonas putida]